MLLKFRGGKLEEKEPSYGKERIDLQMTIEEVLTNRVSLKT